MELFRALAALVESPGEEHRRLGDLLEIEGTPDPSVHTQLFAFNLYPYASVYLGPEGMLGGEARDRVAGFWRALGLEPPAEPDHLSALLALYAGLAERESEEHDEARRLLRRRSRHALLWEHLASWLGPYLDKVVELDPPFYAGWARLLREAVDEELGQSGGGEELPLQLREAPGLPDPRDVGGAAFLAALVAPVRSGLILTRSDLARGARELGLGLRLGERRYILKALFAQEPDATLAWLAGEARTGRARYQAVAGTASRIAAFWSSRAAATAELVESLRPTNTAGLAAGGAGRGASWSHETDPD